MIKKDIIALTIALIWLLANLLIMYLNKLEFLLLVTFIMIILVFILILFEKYNLKFRNWLNKRT